MSNNILVNEQYGFRSNSSTEKASYKLLNEILTALNNKILVGGIFCELKKAFDYVNFDILLSKLEFSCHHGMARPQVADGGDSLQIWRVAANVLNKQSHTADKEWSSS
jgi:hypothetical protein